jgi:inhibitor of KinA
MTLAPLGDSAVVITVGPSVNETTSLRVRSLVAALENKRTAGVIDVVPAYTTVTVFYDMAAAGMQSESPYDRVARVVTECVKQVEQAWPDVVRETLERVQSSVAERTVEIPVCYGGELGPDLLEVARHAGLDTEEVIRLHVSTVYEVQAVGFAPGFPYLSGLNPRLHTPRKSTPRVQVAAGSVGIGGSQTGIYPLKSPGGWQLIGRTPRRLFDVQKTPPALLRVGDRIAFRRIKEQEFAACT